MGKPKSSYYYAIPYAYHMRTVHTICIYAYGMDIHTIWVYGDMKAAEAQRYYWHIEMRFLRAAAISYADHEVFEVGA